MRKFNVRVEDTDFELEVEEVRTVPVILAQEEHHAWVDRGHQEVMHAH